MTDTQSSLASFRRCARLYELRYEQRLELALDQDREALEVGSCWHHAQDVRARGGDPYEAIVETAPSILWLVKLSRLFAAHEWYWKSFDQALPFEVVSSERTFRVELGDDEFDGQIDRCVRAPDGRRGIVEFKTTADSIELDSDYWKKLRLDVQIGLYGLAEGRPEFILYDVVRKPTINPKAITQKDQKRLRKELAARGSASYYGEEFTAQQLEEPLAHEHESPELYGARLTADIGDRPDQYFARREVPRTHRDYDALERDLFEQRRLIDHARADQTWPRNPDACHDFGTCVFFRLCSINLHPRADEPPEGFRRRAHLHPELVRSATQPTAERTP